MSAGQVSLRRTVLALAVIATASVWELALAAALADPLGEARQHDGWITYAVPLAGDKAPCCWSSWRNGDRAGQRGCTLDGTQRNGFFGTFDDGDHDRARRAPGPKPALQVYLKFARGEVQRFLAVGSDCPVDAGRSEVRALDGVTPTASVALLMELAAGHRRDHDDEAWYALSLHAEVGLDALLTAARDGGRAPKDRRQALFWLAQSDDPRALELIESILAR